MQTTIKDDISAINEAIAERVGPQKFRIWFKNSTMLTLVDGYVKIGVPNLFIASWIENHFSNEISQAVRAVTGSERKITFSIDPELSGHQRRAQLDSQAKLVEKTQNRTIHPRTKINRPTRRPLKLSLNTFVVGPSNELAYNTAKAVVEQEKSPFNPLF
ncbi:MAG: hypothetical protein KAS75_06285, partial [Planctomycetes bacterium]|nr:hypothetical protein [Planctomycetota bacterium]